MHKLISNRFHEHLAEDYFYFGRVTTKIIKLDLDLSQPRKFHQKHWRLPETNIFCGWKSDDDKLHAKSVQLSLQGQWTRWCDDIKLDLSRKNLLAMQQPLLSFCLGATYDTLTSLSNLYRWHIAPEAVCFLCSKQVCTLAHILRACRVALQQGRFTFHHYAVLQVLVSSIKSFLTSYQVSKTKFPYIKICQSWFWATKNFQKKNCGLLHTAPDWVLFSDIESTLVIPPAKAISQWRPDINLYSTSTKTVIILELTCLYEENMVSWYPTKFGKYNPLCSAIKTNSWSLHFFAVEVRARG